MMINQQKGGVAMMSDVMTCDAVWSSEDLYNIATQAAARLRVKRKNSDDSIQEAVTRMIVVIRSGKVDFSKNWRGYLYSIALKTIINYVTRKLKKWDRDVAVEGLCEGSYYDSTDDKITVQELIRKLPSRYASVVRDYISGKTISDMARERGQTLENVRQILAKAINKMRLYACR